MFNYKYQKIMTKQNKMNAKGKTLHMNAMCLYFESIKKFSAGSRVQHDFSFAVAANIHRLFQNIWQYKSKNLFR